MSWETEVIVGKEQEFPTAMVAVRMATGERVRYVPERTCHDKHGGDAWCFSCDACGCAIPWRDSFDVRTIRGGSLNYCPNCGAKVANE